MDLSEQYAHLQPKLEELFLHVQGIHTDEYDNFDQYLPEMVHLTSEFDVYYLDILDRLHHVFLKDCFFVRPYEPKVGLDLVDTALVRGNYEATMRGTVVYEVRVTPSVQEQVNGPRVVQADVQLPSSNQKISMKIRREQYRQRIIDKKWSDYSVVIQSTEKPNHWLMDIPPLIGSSLCHMRSGGFLPVEAYFRPKYPTYCVSRNFKVFPSEEGNSLNRILSHKADHVEVRSGFYDPTRIYRTNSTLKLYPKTSKIKMKGPKSPFIHLTNPTRFMIEIPYEKPPTELPVSVFALHFGCQPHDFVGLVQRHLGWAPSEHDRHEIYFETLRLDIEGCQTPTDATLRIGKCLATTRKMKEPSQVIEYMTNGSWRFEFLPNLFHEDREIENARRVDLLSACTAEAIRIFGESDSKYSIRPQDGRSYAIKRLESAGEKLTALVKKNIKELAKHAYGRLESALEKGSHIHLYDIINAKMIKLTESIKSGTWDCKLQTSDSNQHKTQMMITGFCSDSSHMQTQKITKTVLKKNADVTSLLTHPTQSGRVDPYFTPETQKCGIVRYKSLGAVLSGLMDIGSINVLIEMQLQTSDHFTPLTKTNFLKGVSGSTSVYNGHGALIGWTTQPLQLYLEFQRLRRKCVLPPHVGMDWDGSRATFHFHTEAGRLLRPLLIWSEIERLVKNFSLAMSVNDLLAGGYVEYLDACEEYCGWIKTADSIETAMSISNESSDSKALSITHVEISPSFSFTMGVVKPFMNHNSGPRRLQTGNLTKRAIAQKLFVDGGTTSSYSLWYAQDPIVSDPIDKVLQLRHMEPNSCNVELMILADEANIEDACVMNQAAIDRGLGICSEYHVVTVTLGLNQVFTKPSSICKGRASAELYQHLHPNGLPKIGMTLLGGFACVGKVFFWKQNGVTIERCMSKFLSSKTCYRVVSVMTHPNMSNVPLELIRSDAIQVVQVTLIQTIPVEEGNKGFIAAGQKFTFGRIVSPEDMAWIARGPNAGLIPDIMLSCFSLLRVTEGLHLQMLWGKARCLSPTLIDQYDTIFTTHRSGNMSFASKLAIVSEVLKNHHMDYRATDYVCSGTTGKPLKCAIFCGSTPFSIVKQIAQEKSRARPHIGPIVQLTRAGVTGAKAGPGSLSQGWMENACLHSHGASAIFENFNYHSADRFTVYHCTQCQMPALGCPETGFYLCTKCKTNEHVVQLPIPYISNLTMQEAMTCGWGHRFHVTK